MKRTTDRTLLGNLLLERNLISQGDLEQAITLQKSTQQQLGKILVAQKLVTRKDISRILNVQRKLRATLLTTLLSFAPLAIQGCAGISVASTEAETALSVARQSQTLVSISLQPQSQQVAAGHSVTLNVSALGSAPLRYQWTRNGEPIPNAVTASLTLTRTTEADSGVYAVTVSNDEGSQQSAPADINVLVDRSATLTWEPPGRREDGSRLQIEHIKGYRIYHSSEDGLQDASYDVAADDQSLTLDNLPRGIHYFAVTAVDVNELESSLSNVIEKRIF